MGFSGGKGWGEQAKRISFLFCCGPAREKLLSVIPDCFALQQYFVLGSFLCNILHVVQVPGAHFGNIHRKK